MFMMRKQNSKLGKPRRTIVFNVDVARRRKPGAAGFRRAAGLAAAAAGIAYCACALVFPAMRDRSRRDPAYPVRWIEVSNEENLSRSQIIALAGLRINDDLLAVDLRKARERLRSHPDIRDATLSRRIPGGVLIRVSERFPIAAFYAPPAGAGRRSAPAQPAAHRYVVDEEGMVLSERKEKGNLSLPVIEGLRPEPFHPGRRLASPEAAKALAVVCQYRESELCRQFDLMSVDVRNADNLVLRSNWIQEIRLGAEDIPDRLRLLSFVLRERRARGVIAPASYLDLRWKNIAEMPIQKERVVCGARRGA